MKGLQGTRSHQPPTKHAPRGTHRRHCGGLQGQPLLSLHAVLAVCVCVHYVCVLRFGGAHGAVFPVSVQTMRSAKTHAILRPF